VSITDVVDDPGAEIRLGPRGTNSGSYLEIETDLIAAMVFYDPLGQAPRCARPVQPTVARRRRQIVGDPFWPGGDRLAGTDDLGLGD
jgi:hypothetical protein